MKFNGKHLKKEDVCCWLMDINLGLSGGKLIINYYEEDANNKKELKIELDQKESRELYKYALKNFLKSNDYKGD